MNSKKSNQDLKLSILLLSFVQIMMICLSVTNSRCEGVKLFVSNLPPRPPYVTSLYKAPETYFRKKPPQPSKPLILISKLRPCYNFHNGKYMARKKIENSTTTTTTTTTASTTVSTRSSVNRTISPTFSNQEFTGHWQITKPKLKVST